MDAESHVPMTEELFQSLLALAVKRNASDVHFEVGYPPTYRVYGELLPAKYPPLTCQDTECIARLVLQAPGPGLTLLDVREVERSYSLPGVSRFRASVLRQRGSWGAVLRTVPFELPELGALDLPPVVATVTEARRGLVLVTGANGNGKTTTIAAILNHIVQRERLHVVTIEDPIEFVFPAGRGLVIQREIGPDTAGHADALRSALRQDPDVIMVAALRGREAAEICLEAAETGHLVITTLHTSGAARSLSHFVGLFPAEEQQTTRARLADCLQAVVSLRLLRRSDGSGLVPAVEALLATSAAREIIREGGLRMGELTRYLDGAGAELGMHSFDAHLRALRDSGRISVEAGFDRVDERSGVGPPAAPGARRGDA